MRSHYYIEFDNLDIEMSKRIRISKEQFMENLKYLHEQAENTKDEEYQVQYINTYHYDYDRFEEFVYVFGLGTSTTRLTHSHCKNGYKFCKKGE